MPKNLLEYINQVSDVEEIEIETRKQNKSLLWIQLRKSRITASHAGDTCKTVRCGNLCKSYAEQILKPKNLDFIPAIRHGRKYENVALNKYQQHKRFLFKKCGLFIDPVHTFLAASPDGIIPSNKKIVEIKCPFSLFKDNPKRAPYFTNSTLNRNHKYYFQVQLQMYVMKMYTCDFVVYTSKGILIDSITYDSDFTEKMIDDLILYYNEFFLPLYLLQHTSS